MYLTPERISAGLSMALILGAMTLVAALVAVSRLPRSLKILICAALALRIVGAVGRFLMVTELYNNVGDSFMYYAWGQEYAGMLWSGDFAGLLNQESWSGNKWWGTQFVRYLTGLMIFLIGPTFLGGFLFFSLLAFVGLVGFGMAFHRSYPDVPVTSYLRWAWLFPSLWFWPSAIGKEAVLLMGLGLAMWGFVGRNERINWPLLGMGLFFVFAIRVQVAAVVVVTLVLAQWLSLSGKWTLGRVVQGVLILALGLATMQLAARHLGIESLDADGVQGYLEDNTGRGYSENRVRGGGSSIEGTRVGIGGIPLALVNILMRPFPWEARNPQMMITAAEILAFWLIVWVRRKSLLAALKNWRDERLLRVAVPFVLLYSISLGMLLSNIGLIARQRIFLFPFLFLLVEAVPRVAARRRERAPGTLGIPARPPHTPLLPG